MNIQQNDRMTSINLRNPFPLDARTYVSSITALEDLLIGSTVYDGLPIALVKENSIDNYVLGVVYKSKFIPYEGTYTEQNDTGTFVVTSEKILRIKNTTLPSQSDGSEIYFKYSPDLKLVIFLNGYTKSKTLHFEFNNSVAKYIINDTSTSGVTVHAVDCSTVGFLSKINNDNLTYNNYTGGSYSGDATKGGIFFSSIIYNDNSIMYTDSDESLHIIQI